MTPTPTPTIGRIVHYVSHESADGEWPSRCRAAVITDVPEVVGMTANDKGYNLDLCVLAPDTIAFHRDVPRSSTGMVGGTWHWPERVE